MKIQLFLTINQNGSVRTSKGMPNLKSNEITMRLNLNVPDKIFLKPRLEASISIPEDSIQSAVIEPEVVDNIKETILEHTGIELDIKVVPPEMSSLARFKEIMMRESDKNILKERDWLKENVTSETIPKLDLIEQEIERRGLK